MIFLHTQSISLTFSIMHVTLPGSLQSEINIPGIISLPRFNKLSFFGSEFLCSSAVKGDLYLHMIS